MRMGRLLGTAMAKQLMVLSAVLVAALVCRGAHASFGRGGFPDGFMFGTGSASYQYEGAYKEGGKGPSIWDVFSHIPGKVRNNDNGDVADDLYHRFREDVKLLKDMNMDAFRFSIAWTRILPTGSLSGGINKEGVAFYNNLINEALDTKYGSFLSENIIKDYVDFAEVCFREFGDRVKFWSTFNEPWTYASQGYGTGAHAPGRCSPFVSKTCTPGDSGREPYVVAHHILLAHAEAVRLYRAKYAAAQGGQIGLVAVSHWFVPNRDTPADRRAVQRSLDFMFGWFLDPLVRGEYPGTMRAYLGDRLPRFTPAQRHGAVLRRRHPRQHVRVPRRRARRRARVRAHLLQLPRGHPGAAALHSPPLQQPRDLRHGERHRRGEQPADPAARRAQGRAQDQVPLAAPAVREARHEGRRQRQGLLHLDIHGLLRVGRRLSGSVRTHLHRPPQRPQALPQGVQLLDREVPQKVTVIEGRKKQQLIHRSSSYQE